MGLISFRRFKEILEEEAKGWIRTTPYSRYNDNDEAVYQSKNLPSEHTGSFEKTTRTSIQFR